MSVNVPLSFAMQIASEMLGMEVTECDDDVRDALGEIANMAAGSFKHHFVTGGHEVRLSTPSIISGEEYSMTSGSVPDTLTILFSAGAGKFMVSIWGNPNIRVTKYQI